MSPNRRLPLQLRVALAFAVTTALALTALGVFLHLRVGATLESQIRDGVSSQLDALERLPAAEQLSAVQELTGASFAQVLDHQGEVIASSPQLTGAILAPAEVPAPGAADTMRPDVYLVSEGESAPAIVEVRSGDRQSLVLGESAEDVQDALEGVTTQLLVGGPLALFLASALGYAVAGAALRPMERMRAHAAVISARNSGDRLPLPDVRDEVHRLGSTLNDMLDRLDEGLRRERRFVAEASHELRTPLALLRAELDLAASRPRSHAEHATFLASATEEVDRLSVLVDQLLLLAQADDGRLELDRVPFAVHDLLDQVARRFVKAAEGRTVVVTGGKLVEVVADRGRMDQAVTNLVDNAVRHGGGDITLASTLVGDRVLITVTDQGGARLDRELVDRFRRIEGSHGGGHGLGLSLVRAIVSEHGGTVHLSGGSGVTTVTLDLPA